VGIFTFGREHEKKCAARYVRDPSQVPLLLTVVDAAHDLIEGKGPVIDFVAVCRSAFVGGGTGVWENTEGWIRKCSSEHPEVLELWRELAAHPKAEIRFRVACILNDLPRGMFEELSGQLVSDKSKKVSKMALARTAEVSARDAT